MNTIRKTLELLGTMNKGSIEHDSDIVGVHELGDTIYVFGEDGLMERDLEAAMQYRGKHAIVPLCMMIPELRKCNPIDPMEYKGFVQLESGIAVPEHIAKEAGLGYASYTPGQDLFRMSLAEGNKVFENVVNFF